MSPRAPGPRMAPVPLPVTTITFPETLPPPPKVPPFTRMILVPVPEPEVLLASKMLSCVRITEPLNC